MNPLFIIFGVLIGSIALCGSLMYIVIMGPSRYHRDGIIGKANRVVVAAPLYFCGFLFSIFFFCNQKRSRQWCKRYSQHVFHERNYLMVGFYILLVWTVEVLYLFFALPRLKASFASKALSWGLVLLSELLYGLAVFSDPGRVTAKADLLAQQKQFSRPPRSSSVHQKTGKRGAKAPTPTVAASSAKHFLYSPEKEEALNHRYVVDGMLYALCNEGDLDPAQRQHRSATTGALIGVGQSCSTCVIPRPSRSKHCRLCGSCVRRFDHHCPWINNDVAEQTMRYFLSFLLTHAISCTWACIDLSRSLRQFLIASRAWGWVLYHPNGRYYPLQVADYMYIVVNFRMMDACLLFFAFFIALVLYGFWVYQMLYAVSNLTVNDMMKIDDTVQFVSTLPTVDLVYREAKKVRDRLAIVAERKPTALMKLIEPPPPKTVPGFEEGGKKNQAYRRSVEKMLRHDLKGIYDRGMWQNLAEIFFPDRISASSESRGS